MEKYEKIKIIGRGAYGTVYLCRRISDGCHFIIKQIPVEEMSKEERQAAMNEVDVLKRLTHPNIISYLESFFEGRALMINLELLRQIYTTAGRGAKNIKFEITKKICEHFTFDQNAAPERINSIFRLFQTKSSYPKSLKKRLTSRKLSNILS